MTLAVLCLDVLPAGTACRDDLCSRCRSEFRIPGGSRGNRVRRSRAGRPAAGLYAAADKLARAIALSRIRNILNLGSSIWASGFVAAARLPRVARHREMGTACLEPALGAGLVFFVAYFVITALAGG